MRLCCLACKYDTLSSTDLDRSVPARTGLGVPQAKRFRTYFSASSNDGSSFDNSSASDPLPDLQGYLARVKSSMDERRAFGLLRSLRRTCEELDRRAGIEDSPMWRDPDEEEREQARVRSRKIYDRIDTELDSDDERKNVVDSADKAGRGKAGRGELAYEIGTSGTVVELEDEDDDEDHPSEAPTEEGSSVAAAPAPDRRHADDIDEAAEWFSYDVRSPLSLPDHERIDSGCLLAANRSGRVSPSRSPTCGTSTSAFLPAPRSDNPRIPDFHHCTVTASGAVTCTTIPTTSRRIALVPKRRTTSA